MRPKNKDLDMVINELRDSLSKGCTDINIFDRHINELRDISLKAKQEKKAERILYIVIVLVFSAILTWTYMFLDRNNVLEAKVNNIENELKYYQHRDSMFVKIMGLESPTSIVYRVKDNKPITYQELSNISDSCSIHLKVILNQYPIKVKRKGNSYWAESAQIDSALMLLPVYRNMITYDSKKKIWEIKR